MQMIQAKPLLPTKRELVARIFRQRAVFLTCFLLVIAGFVLTGQFKPKYRSEMKILVRKERVDPIVTTGQTSTPELQTMSVREEDLNSEVEILKGDGILRQVVVQAGLVPRGSADPVSVEKALKKLQRNLEVSAVTKTDLISARYESDNPEQSRRVLAALKSIYLDNQRNVQGRDYQVSFFDEQVRDHGIALRAAEAKLMDFTRRTGVVSAGLERELTVRQMKDLNEKRVETNAGIGEAQGRAAQLAAEMRHRPTRIPTEIKVGDNPQLLNQLKATLLGLQLKRTELLNKYDAHYRMVEDVDREIAIAQSMLDGQTAAPVREDTSNLNPTRVTLETELATSRAQLNGLRAKASQLSRSAAALQRSAENLSEKENEQETLLRDVKTEKDQYQLYVDKLEQTRMTHSLDRGGILNVAVEQEPVAPALPQNSPLGVLAAALFTGGLLSLGAAFISDVFDPTIRTVGELNEALPVPLLAAFGPNIYIERGKP